MANEMLKTRASTLAVVEDYDIVQSKPQDASRYSSVSKVHSCVTRMQGVRVTPDSISLYEMSHCGKSPYLK